jgi:hypothetical protein
LKNTLLREQERINGRVVNADWPAENHEQITMPGALEIRRRRQRGLDVLDGVAEIHERSRKRSEVFRLDMSDR